MRGILSVVPPALLLAALAASATARDPVAVLEIKGWGTAIDPDGDCTFSVGRSGVAIAIPGTVHALSAELGRMNAPRVLHQVEGDFIAEVKVSGVEPPDAASKVPGRRPFRGAGLLVWQDGRTYIRLERAALLFDGEPVTYTNFESRKERRFERPGTIAERPLDGKATHLRLERRGSTVLASVSRDGVRWTTLEPLSVDLPARLRVGVAAVHNTPLPFEPRFEGFTLSRDGQGLPQGPEVRR